MEESNAFPFAIVDEDHRPMAGVCVPIGDGFGTSMRIPSMALHRSRL